MSTSHSFQTVFAVPLTCEACVRAVSNSLHALGTVSSVEASLPDQLVTVVGTAAPSALVEAIQTTGRDAILRGSGEPNSAAVSILESYAHLGPYPDGADDFSTRNVRGLARIVQVSPTTTLIDLSVRGVSPGTYRASVRASGNLVRGALSVGPVWRKEDGGEDGAVGTLQVGPDGRGALFVGRPFQVWEIIGRAMALAKMDPHGEVLANDTDTLVGVVARSAGVWDNDKLVCSCTGKTLWDERADEVENGML